MVDKPLIKISRHPNVEASVLVLNDVDPCHAGTPSGLVAGAGFEPATFRL
jgi:hypothetical protein